MSIYGWVAFSGIILMLPRSGDGKEVVFRGFNLVPPPQSDRNIVDTGVKKVGGGCEVLFNRVYFFIRPL